jgi:small GTP-binding protein
LPGGGLSFLNLSHNEIGDKGAKALANLAELSSLDLSHNAIGDKGAKALADLTGLSSLAVTGNKIGKVGLRTLLDAWADSPQAADRQRLAVYAAGNEPLGLPAELFSTNDAQEVLAAWRAFREAEQAGNTQPINEVKLLIMGDEAVGKTTLARYLVEGKPRNKNEKKTPGIKLHERIETKAWAPDGQGVTLNIWDFGGQEVMRGTHRYFLTARSLYLLVLENRREDDAQKVREALSTMRDMGDGSPVLIVISKCDAERGYVRKDDEQALRAEFDTIIGILRVTCNDDEASRQSIDAVRQAILSAVADDERLSHVRDSMPPSWVRVKQAVTESANDQSVLTWDRYRDICRGGPNAKTPITDEAEQGLLLRLLNDLGTVVAHGAQEGASATRREITLLDPNWLTRAIYQVMDRAGLEAEPGVFRRAQLADWLDPAEYPSGRHDFILDMMTTAEFGLAVRLPGGDDDPAFLAPRTLPATAPDFGGWQEGSLRFRYHYAILPDSLFPRFIVEAHRDLGDGRTRWFTGAVLEIEGCPILVRADLGQRRIDIWVAGDVARRRTALSHVRLHLQEVHARFPEARPEARVPLPDDPKIDVGYDHLEVLERDEGTDYEIRPEGAARKYRIYELLSGVRPERVAMKDSPQMVAGMSIYAETGAVVTVATERGTAAGPNGQSAGGDQAVNSGSANDSKLPWWERILLDLIGSVMAWWRRRSQP